VNAPGAWDKTVGTMNRIVCIIDSGVDYRHPDLAAHMWSAADGTHGWNYIKDNADPMDDAGHGTHVAGIAAAIGGNDEGIVGVAQEKILAVKVLDKNGNGRESDAAFALQFCADKGANVASLSLGTDKDKAVFRDGVGYALKKGLLITAAAGNEGCSCVRYPAAYAGVLAVASFGESRAHSAFSNTGSWIDISAPGEDITSTYLGGDYRVGTGTSQATPFVAGVAALAWGAKPTLTASQVASILTSTALDLGASGKDSSFGYGAVDAHKAVDAALSS
jgi:subtilisin family serine protease